MDLYQEITNRIIEQMDSGIIPWERPWIGSNHAVSYTTGKPYSLLNQMLLGEPGEYITYKQCIQAGGHVRKGEKARIIVFWKWLQQEDEETDSQKEAQVTSCDAQQGSRRKKIPYLRYYSVFHISQCEGITAKHNISPCKPVAADETADAIISSYLDRSGVKLRHLDISSAFYRPSDDTISLPLQSRFKGTAEYYSTTFHEMVHSSGHKSRLDRLDKTAFFGSESYSKEELIAELGAAALLHHTGLETTDSFRNNAAYIQNWLQVLRNDKRFIVSAASKAEKAVNLILGNNDCKVKA